MRLYKVTASVELRTPLPIDDRGDTSIARGYYRNFTVYASSEYRVQELVEANCSDGHVDWARSDIQEHDAADGVEEAINVVAGRAFY
jgi:hypothetical protein